MNLADRVVVITGAASGLGRATVVALAEGKAKIAALDLNAASAKRLCAELGRNAFVVPTDVADSDSVSAAIVAVMDRFERIDVCVNAAGKLASGKIVKDGRPLPLDEFRASLAINLVGAFDVMRHCAARMVGNEPDADGERGVIINVSSIAASQGQTGQTAYAASKAGLVGLMLPAARDLAPVGIRVVTICPGAFDTPMSASVPDKVKEGVVSQVLHPRRMGAPEEFAVLVKHIVENRYMNATTVEIDGGVRIA